MSSRRYHDRAPGEIEARDHAYAAAKSSKDARAKLAELRKLVREYIRCIDIPDGIAVDELEKNIRLDALKKAANYRV